VDANEAYNELLKDITDAVEVFQCLPNYEPVNKGHYQGPTPLESIGRSLHGHVGIFGSQLHF
jgi:hypothetical protein